MKIAANYCVYNEENFIAYSLRSIYDAVDKIIILVSQQPWKGIPSTPDKTLQIVRNFPDPGKKIIYKTGKWQNQGKERNYALSICKNLGINYYWVIDADEIYEDESIETLKTGLKDYPNVINFYCGWWTYWRSFYYRIDPPETSTFVIGKIVPSFTFLHTRQPSAGKTLRLDAFLHHYSYARPFEKIKVKMTNISGPGGPIRCDWFEKFLQWPKDKSIGDLHPFWKNHWKRAIKITWDIPPALHDHPWVRREVIV